MYLQLNMSNEEFIDELKKSIKFNIPFSFSRFGDGEIFFINDNVPPQIIKKYLQTTYGYNNIETAKRDVLNIINNALSDTDIIGIMDKKNEIAKRISYRENIWSINTEYVEGLRKGKKIIVADHMITRGKILGDIHNFKEIIQGNDIAIISPFTKLLKENNVQKILDVNVNFIETSLGMNLNDRPNMFSKFDKIKEPIVIYGCSLMGKDFAVHLKNRGKVALDFGSTLDAWSGLHTRPWFQKNGLQSHCLIQKKMV